MHTDPTLDHQALLATVGCLSGCAIGELLGMVVGTAADRWLIARGRGHAVVHAHPAH